MKFQPTTGFVPVGEYFVCNCGVRLIKHISPGVYQTQKKAEGQVVTITSQAKGGMVNVKCEKCGRGMNVLNIQDEMTLS